VPAVTKSIAKQNLTSKREQWNVISVNGAVLWRPSREKDYIHSQVKEQQKIRAVFALTILTAMSCMPKFSMFCRTVDPSLGRNVCPIHFVSMHTSACYRLNDFCEVQFTDAIGCLAMPITDFCCRIKTHAVGLLSRAP
jgi:hypothetical protein